MVGVVTDESAAFLAAADASIHAVLRLIPRSVANPSEPTTVAVAPGPKRSKAQLKNMRKQLAANTAAKAAKSTVDRPVHAPGSNAAKLHDKMSALRAARRADDPTVLAKQNWRKQKREEAATIAKTAEGKKMRKENAKDSKKKEMAAKKRKAPDGDDDNDAEEKSTTIKERNEKNRKNKKAKAAESDGSAKSREASVAGPHPADIIEIASVKGFAGDDAKKDKTRRKKRKETRLEQLKKSLVCAEAEQQKTAQLAVEGGSDAGGELLDKEMEKAMLRAQGVSVKDKASKLRKTIRKETRKKEKSREDWAARIESVTAEKEQKQGRREERLRVRRESKSVKKGGDGSHKKAKSTTAHKKRH
jgi:Surfeit locus protein 6